jgi:hypothetical protein
MQRAGARPADDTDQEPSPDALIEVVIRSPVPSVKGYRRAVERERSADVLLGSARPVFAERLVESLLGEA